MKKAPYLVGLTILAIALCGCDEGGGSDSGPAAGVNVTGTWQGTSSDGISFTANIAQQPDGAIAGTVRRQEGYTGTISGRVSGTDFSMHVIWTYGGVGDYEGDVIGNSIEGTFDERVGAIRMTGTFTAFKQ